MTDTKHSAERAAFERHFMAEGWSESSFERYDIYDPEDVRGYRSRHVADMWDGWQARAAIAAAAPAGEPVAWLKRWKNGMRRVVGFDDSVVLLKMERGAEADDVVVTPLYATPVSAAVPAYQIPAENTSEKDNLLKKINHLVLAETAPKPALTASEIDDMVFGFAPSCKIGEGRELVAHVASLMSERVQAKPALTDEQLHFMDALNGGKGDLDAWLECNNEAECRAIIAPLIAASGPNAALVEALQGMLGVWNMVCDASGWERDHVQQQKDAVAALVAAGVGEAP